MRKTLTDAPADPDRFLEGHGLTTSFLLFQMCRWALTNVDCHGRLQRACEVAKAQHGPEAILEKVLHYYIKRPMCNVNICLTNYSHPVPGKPTGENWVCLTLTDQNEIDLQQLVRCLEQVPDRELKSISVVPVGDVDSCQA